MLNEKLNVPIFDLSIVIPVFNAADTISILVKEIIDLNFKKSFEVILVNDGSSDNSAEICRNLTATMNVPITLVDLTKNFGENNAILAGMKEALGEYIITMADDLQHSPKDIPKLFSVAYENNFDVVYSDFEKKHYPWYRNLGSWFANATATTVLGKPSSLYLSPFRCINQTVVKQITKYIGPYPYIDGLIFQITGKVGRVKIPHHPRAKNRSNYTLMKLISLWLNIFFNFSPLPMRACLFLGLICEIFAISGIFIVLYDVLTYGRTVPGYASLMIASLFFGGAQFIFLGFVGEYVSRTHILVGGKPQFVVRNLMISSKKTVLNRQRLNIKK